MANKPKINGVALFFIIFIAIEVVLSGVWFVNIIISEPSSSVLAPSDEGKLLDQNKYYEIVNPSLSAKDDTETAEIRNPFGIIQ